MTNPYKIEALVAQAESLCRKVAPIDLADRPLYIVMQSQLPDYLSRTDVCEGYTATCLDIFLRDVIGAAWKGRGACIVVNDLDFETMDVLDREVVVRWVVLHELAHILELSFPYLTSLDLQPAEWKEEAQLMAESLVQQVNSNGARPSHDGHGKEFIRIALHLYHRTVALGHDIAASQICAGRTYGLSRATEYLAALGDEPERMAQASFREILSAPYPEAFSRLWAADVAHRQSLVSY